jgi:hypothetical protein
LGWLKDKAQNAVYRTAIAGLVGFTDGNQVLIGVVQACAAQNVVETCRHFFGANPTYVELAKGTVDVFSGVDPEILSACEGRLLEVAEAFRRNNATLANYSSVLAAGFFSTHKRRDFRSQTALALINGIRVGALSVDAAGCSEHEDMETIRRAVQKLVGIVPR